MQHQGTKSGTQRGFLPPRWRKAKGALWLNTFVLLGTFLFAIPSFSQQQHLQYAINRNGKTVGNLSFEKSTAGTRTTYNIHSEVKVAVLLTVTVQAREQSVYDNDVLQSSSMVRHVNGRQKANKQIVNNGSGLTVSADGHRKELKNFRVKYNMHCLYSVEPIHFGNVFSDNYQQFIPIIKMADHHYRIAFPDGGSNEYFYENGVCKKVKVKSNLFDAEFVLL